MTITKNIISLLFILFLTFSACKEVKNKDQILSSEESRAPIEATINKNHLIGSWLDQSEAKLHFSLMEDGTARSDNMKTLLYKKWRLEDSELFLTAESIGNKISSIDEESYHIRTLTNDKMILQQGNRMLKYVKKK